MTDADEQQVATQTDAQNRVDELRAVAARLLPDRDDAMVRSELVVVIGELRQAERELRAVPTC